MKSPTLAVFRLLVAIGSCALTPLIATAQESFIGRVVDERSKNGVAGATISIPGYPGTARTDAEGRFTWSPRPEVAPKYSRTGAELTLEGAGNPGVFGGWGLRFGAVAGRDDPAELLAIPDPVRVEAVNVQAVADRAVAWPVAGGAIGSIIPAVGTAIGAGVGAGVGAVGGLISSLWD